MHSESYDWSHGSVDLTSAFELDHLPIINETGVPVSEEEIRDAMRRSPELAALEEWASSMRGTDARTKRRGGLLDRDRYVVSDQIYEQFRLAAHAAEHDDNVSGVIESTENLALAKMTMDASDPDEENIWNQIAADLDLDARLREMWREMFIYSQVVCAVWWGKKTYTVKGTTEKGNKKRLTREVYVPTGMTMLDPLKVVPVGNFFFNQEQLAYVADREEGQMIQAVLDGTREDQFIGQLMLKKYKPSDAEVRKFSQWGLDRLASDRIFLLNPEMVFRHTETRAQYKPFAPVRMKSIFELLDRKAQLSAQDRAFLVGGTNFIVLITKGSDDKPASQAEINALHSYARVMAQIPFLVGDHRLDIKIIAPPQEQVLKAERYNSIDARITARLYNMLLTGNYAAGAKGDDSIKLSRVVGQGLSGRRHMLKRTLEKEIWKRVVERNPDAFSDLPDLRFIPKHITMEFDANFATFYLEIRQNREISRETFLSEFDIDQEQEAQRLEREADLYDDIFQSAVPFDSPEHQVAGGEAPADPGAPAAQKAAGRAGGGNKNGGGAAPNTGQGKKKEQA